MAVALPVFCSVEEKLLKNQLLKPGSKVRPVDHFSNNLTVTVDFVALYLKELNEENQMVSIFGWSRAKWLDKSLAWDPKKHGNVTFISVSEGDIWTPELKIFTGYREQKQDFGTVKADGQVVWVMPGFYNFHCPLDFTGYPSDIQNCKVILGSWAYDNTKISLQKGILSTIHYKKNLKWKLVYAKIEEHHVKYDCCSSPYDDVTFIFSFNRTNFVHPRLHASGI